MVYYKVLYSYGLARKSTVSGSINAGKHVNYIFKTYQLVVVSWTTSCSSYLDPVIIQIDLLTANFQLNVTSYPRMTLSSFFLS